MTAASEGPPLVSVVVETSTWHEEGHIRIQDTLEALRRQTYPPERLEIVLVVTPERRGAVVSLSGQFPEVRRVEAPRPLSYYQLKGCGLRAARGDIVAFADADTWVAPNWIEEMVRPFGAASAVGAVYGRHRFRQSFLSRMWDTVWWARAYEKEGPIDRLYAANNVAFRREVLEQHFYDDPNSHRGVWERVLTGRLRSAGWAIWLNPRATFVHDYEPRLSYMIQLGLARGYHLLAVRLERPEGLDRLLGPLRWVAPWLLFPPLLVKDSWRILTRAPRVGLRRWEIWKAPVYMLAYVPLEFAVLTGMVLAAMGRPAPPLP